MVLRHDFWECVEIYRPDNPPDPNGERRTDMTAESNHAQVAVDEEFQGMTTEVEPGISQRRRSGSAGLSRPAYLGTEL